MLLTSLGNLTRKIVDLQLHLFGMRYLDGAESDRAHDIAQRFTEEFGSRIEVDPTTCLSDTWRNAWGEW